MIRALVVLIILVGFGMLFYPFVSNWWNDHCTSRLVADYQEQLDSLPDESVDDMLADADAFNQKLTRMHGRWELSGKTKKQYTDTLDIFGTGLIGTLYMPKLNAVVPFYHGDSDSVLQVAGMHMSGSSFPVEGECETVHAVIAAHTGMASLDLFTKLDQLEIGDTFLVQVLNRQYTYTVSEINVVLPDEMEYLDFQEGRNLCTLLTCTPVNVNSHRLLVTGELTDSVLLSEGTNLSAVGRRFDYLIWLIPVIVLVLYLLALCWRRFRRSRN